MNRGIVFPINRSAIVPSPPQVGDGRHGKTLTEHISLPAKGFVNAVAVARSGRFVLAGLGQEPRLGRWARNPKAKNGVLLHSLVVDDTDP